ncbi:TIGR02757 family protein [Patiriisocius hiemis]|uniref:TIGR02757 family protein n=1 Tax=Patiriisocius hiemis TaxID=3075604 RepID=A0ABU2YBB2_9FLAO|nr:TIGR02757 family protein [Constantimarinum sp. W242]MDT0554924.1 TIGR02757 family protein [Constantimarinum sp. W242]
MANKLKIEHLKDFLDEKAELYDNPRFIESDPIQIPHQFTRKEDIEIIAFLVATIAWGNRKGIINNGNKLVTIMGNSPYDFILNYSSVKSKKGILQNFVHRTFNAVDLDYFILSLQNIYLNHDGLESIFSNHQTKDSLQPAIHQFKKVFFELNHEKRTEKHVSDPLKNSAAKRINMFLRWMVRPNNTGVDFGLWKSISTSKLSCPLDVHTGNIGRRLGLLHRKTNDAKALIELDSSLRMFDKYDPVKYDFALFGLGVFENFR